MRIFEPSSDEFVDDQTAVVLFNHFGSTVSQDTGRDAQELADLFKLPVIGVNRPGTGSESLIPHRKDVSSPSIAVSYLLEMNPIGKEIDKQADSLGITKLITTGRSAGGLAALALARSETVSSLSTVISVEPVGCEKLPLKDGVKRYSEYLKRQKELLNGAEGDELVKPQPPGLALFPAIGRLVSIPPAMLIDRLHNKSLFASDASLSFARYIATNLRSIDTTLVFAEHSLVATPEVYERDLLPLQDLREEGAPFVVKQEKGTVHASFDNRDFMGQTLEPTINLALTK